MVELTQVCPKCSGLELEVGVSDLATVAPLLASELSSRNTLQASQIRMQDTFDLLWVGKLCGHEWVASALARRGGKQGCPYCAGQRVLEGFNDFAFKCSKELAFWDFTKNHILPSQITAKSNRNVWWLCSEGHSKFMSPKSWLYGRCRICSGRELLIGFNDVFSVAPELKAEWVVDKNLVDPLTLRFNERYYKALWQCVKCDHSWYAIIRSRVRGSGCPHCAIAMSRLEDRVFSALKILYDGPIERRQKILKHDSSHRRLELDLVLPELKLAFEVQDFATHSKKSDFEIQIYRAHKVIDPVYKKGPSYHKLKRLLAMEQYGIVLIDIWQDEIMLPTTQLSSILAKSLSEVVTPRPPNMS